ncbi:hypothetical protein KM043_002153 [Ampulex compressa]|nr:hypothetical protein KM043_002153 [Ampulex compressa]
MEARSKERVEAKVRTRRKTRGGRCARGRRHFRDPGNLQRLPSGFDDSGGVGAARARTSHLLGALIQYLINSILEHRVLRRSRGRAACILRAVAKCNPPASQRPPPPATGTRWSSGEAGKNDLRESADKIAGGTLNNNLSENNGAIEV